MRPLTPDNGTVWVGRLPVLLFGLGFAWAAAGPICLLTSTRYLDIVTEAATQVGPDFKPQLPRFFIERPIFAAVLSLFIVIAGLAATRSLPIAQYPEIAPPVVTVTAFYPGASADLMQGFISAPIARAVASTENIDYVTSSSRPSSSTGTTITAPGCTMYSRMARWPSCCTMTSRRTSRKSYPTTRSRTSPAQTPL